MKVLEQRLNYHFKNKALIKQALVHRSASKNHNERLEFLGDGCLNFIIGEALYKNFSEANEGELSNLRAHLVKEETLVQIALDLELNKYIVLSYGEQKNDGAMRASLLADTFEAILGAIFLDSNFNQAKKIVLEQYKPYFALMGNSTINEISEHFKDPKSKLQEKLQALNKAIPSYEVLKITGKDHEQLFKVICKFENLTSIAEGTSKKRAEQKAAQLMLNKIS